MEYFGLTPSPPLDRFIERIWYCSDSAAHTQERVLPGGGTMDIVVNLGDEAIRVYDPANPGSSAAHSGAVVVGTRTRSYLYDPRQRSALVGVHFRPGGAFPFLGLSPFELVDTHAGLADVWGATGRDLREQLLEARSPAAQLRLVETALMRRVAHARAGHPAVRVAVEALRSAGNEGRVSEVAELVGLSHRRFVEVFEREVGVTPKLYARLERFHRVKKRIATLTAAPSWAPFALDCGYCDQSHMLREFLQFSEMSPASYLRGRGDETMLDHVAHAYSTKPAAFRRP